MGAATELADAADSATDHPVVETGARLGLAARTLVWTTIGLLTVAVAAGQRAQPDQTGALSSLRAQAFGKLLLGVMAAGFVSFALYRVVTASVGHRDLPEGRARLLRRAQSAAEVVLYLAAALTTARFALGGGADSERQTDSTTARVMGWTGGRELVALAGAVVVVVGLGMAYRAVRTKHAPDLGRRTPQRLRRPVVLIGAFGMAGRGVVIALVGAFLVQAAVRFDPKDARGLDQTLQALADRPYGRPLLLAAAAALLAFGLWSLAETVWRDV